VKHTTLMKVALLSFLLALSLSSFASSQPFIMGYWGNWHVWDVDKNQRSQDEYQITGSLHKDTGEPVYNPVLDAQLRHLDAIVYSFLEVYPDVGIYSSRQQKPIDPKQIGTVYWSDPWTDLYNDQTNATFCRNNPISCYFAYMINKNSPPPAIDKDQPWNYLYMGNFDAFTKLKGVKKIISIGGWNHQRSFEDGAFANPTQFTNSLIKIINKAKAEGGRIDGIDLDYEPKSGYTNQRGHQLANLVKQLRNGLDNAGLNDVMITAAVFASPDKINALGKENWQLLSKHITYIGIMGYDFHGSWDNPPITGLHSNLYVDSCDLSSCSFSVNKAVLALLEAGVPRSKLILGIPSYGQVVGSVYSNENNGLYQPFSSNHTPQGDLDRGQVSYYKIVNNWLQDGFTEHTSFYQNHVNGVWAYNTTTHQFTAYDNHSAVEAKVDYVRDNGLGGIMMWELISDLPIDETKRPALLKTIHNKLKLK